ncbi:cellulose synthase complex periplasmic endoglucanase BcsZ [Cupriavidus sp. WKF15]|uniref:cellulose synthase complex periplasmic endoglucanase BcsZ n=1 Tax=Cupriavidus sp. WKF15 TaxID=3032282 RepID=UPI0023E327E1|nr:cellulose synthase complex periplasmic endoglucanase BcsZ [Cupriavidus sp. WKF15]WER48376.1 cellulose synthase complex periplasmic endoglucanase BcsZ [Cupriavidus sp. WKF15]
MSAGIGCHMPFVRAASQASWGLWDRYASETISADGRVIEHSREARTTSEGQAYALFFALVANDRVRFDTILDWTLNQLWTNRAEPPAWLWGQRKDGTWGIIDSNSASDAELWIAYSLLEAARLWERPACQQLGTELLAAIRSSEMARLADGGFMLIPGKSGFRLGERTYLLNPSYAPVQVLRRLASRQPDGPWQSVAANQVSLLVRSAPAGYAPDWYRFREGVGFSVEPAKGPTGGYDAIRTYLWAGMLNPEDPSFSELLASLGGMAKAFAASGRVPHYVNVQTGEVFGEGPAGFSAAIYPFLVAAGHDRLAVRLRAQMESDIERLWSSLGYYDKNLLLFSSGWAQGRYRFDVGGFLQLGNNSQ